MGHITTKLHWSPTSSFQEFGWIDRRTQTDRQTPPNAVPDCSMRAGKYTGSQSYFLNRFGHFRNSWTEDWHDIVTWSHPVYLSFQTGTNCSSGVVTRHRLWRRAFFYILYCGNQLTSLSSECLATKVSCLANCDMWMWWMDGRVEAFNICCSRRHVSSTDRISRNWTGSKNCDGVVCTERS